MAAQILRRRKKAVQDNNVQKALEEELERLKRLYNTGYELHEVKWVPNGCEDKDGEVKDGVVYVYTDSSKAVRTLRHEFLHFLISKPAKRYEKIVNVQGALIRSLLSQLLDEAYREEERIVEGLVDALERMEENK